MACDILPTVDETLVPFDLLHRWGSGSRQNVTAQSARSCE
jgi:hypothetical protein